MLCGLAKHFVNYRLEVRFLSLASSNIDKGFSGFLKITSLKIAVSWQFQNPHGVYTPQKSHPDRLIKSNQEGLSLSYVLR
jgi:hypothetical protein